MVQAAVQVSSPPDRSIVNAIQHFCELVQVDAFGYFRWPRVVRIVCVLARVDDIGRAVLYRIDSGFEYAA